MERPCKNLGFTLIELIIVLLILGILSVAIYIKWTTSFGLSSQVALLANDVRYTQNLSMSQNQKFRLVIINNGYQIQDKDSQPVTLPMRNSTTNLEPNISFGTPTEITNTIIFNAKGVPYKDNSTQITKPAVIPLVSGRETINVTIYPETGRVTP